MDDKKSTPSEFPYKGKFYSTEPSTMERVKESFETNDDKAQLEAIRKARQAALQAGIGR